MVKFVATTLVLLASLPTLSFAADTFSDGTLNLKSSITLTDKDSGQTTTLAAGSTSARITVSGAGLFGAGYLKIETPATHVTVKIPRKAYTDDTNFKAYTLDTGFSVNLIGSKSIVVANVGAPMKSSQSCTFNAQQFAALDSNNQPLSYTAVARDISGQPQLDANGQQIVSRISPTVYICLFAPVNGISQIKQSSNAYCQGQQTVSYQPQTRTTSYELDFVNPSNGSSPIGSFTSTLPVENLQKDLGSLNDCK